MNPPQLMGSPKVWPDDVMRLRSIAGPPVPAAVMVQVHICCHCLRKAQITNLPAAPSEVSRLDKYIADVLGLGRYNKVRHGCIGGIRVHAWAHHSAHQ